MSVLVDTSALAEDERIRRPAEGGWAVSIVTVGELEAGVLSANDPTIRARRLARLGAILSEASSLPVDRRVATRYAELRAKTERRPSNDLWIAATALAYDLLLVTADEAQARLPLIRSMLTR